MRLPDGEVIMCEDLPHDPPKAHEYYMRTRQLKGRKKGQSQTQPDAAPRKHGCRKLRIGSVRSKSWLPELLVSRATL